MCVRCGLYAVLSNTGCALVTCVHLTMDNAPIGGWSLRLMVLTEALLERPVVRLMRPASLFLNISRTLGQDHFKADFGLDLQEFNAIHDALQLPQMILSRSYDRVDSKTALLMVLAYLRGRTLDSLEGQYGWSRARVSRVHRATCKLILKRWRHLLNVTSRHHALLRPQRLEYYAAAVKRCTGVHVVWGAVDGTVRPIARPEVWQEAMYNGHKRQHALKWQYVTTPDGLIFLFGPDDGARHDITVWKDSGIAAWSLQHARSTTGEPLNLYGDKGYAQGPGLMTPFRGNAEDIEPKDELFNRVMSKYRITVEWSIGTIPVLFPRFRDKQWQRVGLSAVGQDYKVGALIRNALTCYADSQVGIYMNCSPPTLDEYFSGHRIPRATSTFVDIQEQT